MTDITAARVVPYDLPLRRPWRMAGAEVDRRRGWLVLVECRDGTRGVGDYVLPPTQQKAVRPTPLEALVRRLPGRDLDAALAALPDQPGAGWAVECALMDALARHRGQPLRHLLDKSAPARVAVNGVAEIDGVPDAVAAGFGVVKIKVGRHPPAEEAAALAALALPEGARLRLDANRAWTWDQAKRFIDAVAELPVESLEEPLRDPTLGDLAALQERSPIDIALDESLVDFSMADILTKRPVRRLVLKPAGVGGLRAAFRLSVAARSGGLTCVVTSALDSAVGVTAAAHLAAAVDASGLAHGVSTAGWLAEDVAEAPVIENGLMDLGEESGLGLSLAGKFA